MNLKGFALKKHVRNFKKAAPRNFAIYLRQRPIVKLDSGLSLVQAYVWGLDMSDTFQGAGGVGGLLLVEAGPACYVPAYDHRSNVVGYLDAADGSSAASFAYGPFGETLRETGPKVDELTYRFSTKPTDPTTKFIHYELRTYDPIMGRWLSRDPIGEAGGLNLYGMVGNDPINWIDFLGLDRLVYDGKKICRLSDDLKDCKGCWLADSGKPLDDNATQFDYSEERQKIKNTGPIPEGDYWLPSNRTTDPSKPGIWSTDDWNKYESNDGDGWKPWKTNVNPRSKGPWGEYFVRLEPDPSTETFGRSHFNIHGGTSRGSAGCIDLGLCDVPFFEEVERDGGGERVRVTVDYSGASTKGCPTPDPCGKEE